MAKTIIKAGPVESAAELLEFLQEVEREGRDLSTMYVRIGYPGTEAVQISVQESTLTDQSKVFDIAIQ